MDSQLLQLVCLRLLVHFLGLMNNDMPSAPLPLPAPKQARPPHHGTNLRFQAEGIDLLSPLHTRLAFVNFLPSSKVFLDQEPVTT